MSAFFPVSPLVGIVNTSYAAQVGVIDERWGVRVVRGKKVIAEKAIHQLDLDSIVGVIYGHIRMEGLSRYSVAQCAGRLMQFARRYQESGICPDYEPKGLVRDDGEAYVAVEADSAGDGMAPVRTQGPAASEPARDTRVGQLPHVSPPDRLEAWRASVESQAVMIARLSAYGAALGTEHLSSMFQQVAEELVYRWGLSEDNAEPLVRFCNMILSCSTEGQVPKTGRDRMSIETGQCELLKMFYEMDPSASRFPPGFPCAFHEAVARLVAARTGVNIGVNTSSTGCIVNMGLEH